MLDVDTVLTSTEGVEPDAKAIKTIDAATG